MGKGPHVRVITVSSHLLTHTILLSSAHTHIHISPLICSHTQATSYYRSSCLPRLRAPLARWPHVSNGDTAVVPPGYDRRPVRGASERLRFTR